MSHFDSYKTGEYVERMRAFLALPKKGFTRTIADPSLPVQVGRLPAVSGEPLAKLEEAVNAKAARAEATDSTPAERMRIARDYKGLTDSGLARKLGVSRELVRRWGEGLNRISNLPAVAKELDVPVAWLEYGGGENLPANSHVGVRVGEESKDFREQLYGMTTAIFADLQDNATEMQTQAFIEHAVMTTKPWMGTAARRAGGRWQFVSGVLLFAPWVPIAAHGLSRRDWTDEVEAIIEEELASKPSIYGAWCALKSRCEERGLSYPTKIALHKRVAKEMERAERFGVDLNEVISYAVATIH